MRRGTQGGLRFIGIVPVAALALLTAACSSATDGSSSFSDMFRSSSPTAAMPAAAAAPGAPRMLDSCPSVELRQGAATLTINNNPKDPSAMQLRYQVGIIQTARECSLAGGTLSIRIGVQGRIVLGPVGTHGTLEIPLRYALVQEGPEPRTIYTKLHRIPVSIPEGAPHVSFSHIEETISVPMPSQDVFDSYIVYIGFDALGAVQDRRPPPKKRPAKQS
jgi:hypothetical protein